MAAQPFLDTMTKRRTIYDITKASPIPDARIQEIIKHAILHVPSPFNSQSTRIILLLKGEHDKLWKFAKEAIPPRAEKLATFEAGYATILFFDDSTAIKTMQDKFPPVADRFPPWAAESTAMHQYAIWTALEAEGLGASLQHYQPYLNGKIQEFYHAPKEWQLKAQLVVGAPTAPAGEKTFLPVEERFWVFGG